MNGTLIQPYLFFGGRCDEAIENNPFTSATGKTLHVFFLASSPRKPDLDGLANLKAPSEEFRLSRSLFYLYAPDGIGRSKLAARVEQALGTQATARNWNTVCKLVTLAEEKTSARS